jgi:hypothetical protein
MLSARKFTAAPISRCSSEFEDAARVAGILREFQRDMHCKAKRGASLATPATQIA